MIILEILARMNPTVPIPLALLAEDIYGENTTPNRMKISANVSTTKKLGWKIKSCRGMNGSGYIIEKEQWELLVKAFCKIKIVWEKNKQLTPENLTTEINYDLL